MIHKQAGILVVFLLALAVPVTAQGHGRWEQIWADEFDSPGLPAPGRWIFDTSGNDYGWGNGEDQFYTSGRLENAMVDNGVLTIRALKESMGGKDYTSARLHTRDNFALRYGRVEARMKLPGGRGIWPAFWMMPRQESYGPWPASGEIDIMELFGWVSSRETSANIHTERYNHKIGTNKGGKTSRPDLGSEFHVYAVEWFPDRLDFYLDQEKFFTFRKESADPAVWPYDKPFYIILNNAVGGDWCRQNGGIGDTPFPQELVVDYVRAYKWQSGNAINLDLRSSPGGSASATPARPRSGDTVRLAATPAAGYRFHGWLGDYTGTRPDDQVRMFDDSRVLAHFVPLGEILPFGSFAMGMEGWSNWVDASQAKARFKVDARGIEVQIDRAGNGDWQIQLSSPIQLVQGRRYTLRFMAASTGRARSIRAGFNQARAPYTSYGSTNFTLEGKAREYRMDFVMQQPDDPFCRLEFDLGGDRNGVRLLWASIIENRD